MVLLTAPATADARCHSKAECAQKRACSQKRVVPCIRRAATRWRVSFPLLRSIAWCESRYDPHARNPSGSSGLMQFLPSTYRTTPYARRWIFSAKYNALAGAWLLRQQGTRPWVASRHCWG